MAGSKGPKAASEKPEASETDTGGVAGGAGSASAEATAVAASTSITLEPGGLQPHEEQLIVPGG